MCVCVCVCVCVSMPVLKYTLSETGINKRKNLKIRVEGLRGNKCVSRCIKINVGLC